MAECPIRFVCVGETYTFWFPGRNTAVGIFRLSNVDRETDDEICEFQDVFTGLFLVVSITSEGWADVLAGTALQHCTTVNW